MFAVVLHARLPQQSERQGTDLSLSFLPYDERDLNEEMATFLDTIGQDFPQSWAVGAWTAGRAFEQAVNSIVDADGPNGSPGRRCWRR